MTQNFLKNNLERRDFKIMLKDCRSPQLQEILSGTMVVAWVWIWGARTWALAKTHTYPKSLAPYVRTCSDPH